MDAYKTAMREEIASYGNRLEELRAEIAAVTVRREALEHALELYERTVPTKRERRSTPRQLNPNTTFVLNAIRESGTRGLTTPEIYQKVDEAGLEIPQHTVRSMLHVRKKSKVLEHLDDGRYRFPQPSANGVQPPNSEAPAATTAGASDESRQSDLLGCSTAGDSA